MLTPIIITQPASQAVLPGANVTFSVQAVGLAGATYQWQSNSVNLFGATNTTLTLASVTTNTTAAYRVVVNNAVGSVISSNAVLTVYDVTVPVIVSVSLPTNPVVNYSSNLTLSVVATAHGTDAGFPLAYQWRTNGVRINGVTSSNYTFSVVGSRTYSVTVSNALGGTNASWPVTVFYPGGIIIPNQPVNQYQLAGGNVTFVGSGVSSNALAYQWQFNGTNLPGATGSTLTLSNVSAANEGSYNYILTAGANSLTSSNASFTLVTAPTMVSQSPAVTNYVAPFQTNLTLSVAAIAPGMTNGFPLVYRWQRNGTNLAVANSNAYSFFVDTPLLGNYSVIATNAAGSVTSPVWNVTMTYAGSYIAEGTLAYHLSTNTAAHTNGYSDANRVALSGWFSVGTNISLVTNVTWSTNFWLKGVQGLSATCIGFSNYDGTALFNGQGPATMISPRHYLCAKHMHPEGYPMIAFLDTNNIIYWRSTKQRVDIGTDELDATLKDTSVGILDADLPPSVGFLPVVPTNLLAYLPSNNVSSVQGLGMNQGMMVFSQPMTFTAETVNWNPNNTAPFGLASNWNVSIVGGDSSNPEMLLVTNQLVLASHNFGYLTGPNYSSIFDFINQHMHFLSTNVNNLAGTNDYKLTPFSLTNWPTIH